MPAGQRPVHDRGPGQNVPVKPQRGVSRRPPVQSGRSWPGCLAILAFAIVVGIAALIVAGVAGGSSTSERRTPSDTARQLAASRVTRVTRATPTPQTAPARPHTVEGRGAKVTDPFTLAAGSYRVTSHVRNNFGRRTGDRETNFAIWLHSKTTGARSLLVNEIANNGSWEVAQRIGTGHTFYLEVDATGQWTVQFDPI